MLKMIPDVDTKALEAVIVRLAARIKQKGDWPVEPTIAEWKGFRLWAGVTPRQGFRRVVITPSGKASWAVTLIDANPAKVRQAEHKVMVYLTIGLRQVIGQVDFSGRRPLLRWFGDRKEVKAC